MYPLSTSTKYFSLSIVLHVKVKKCISIEKVRCCCEPYSAYITIVSLNYLSIQPKWLDGFLKQTNNSNNLTGRA